MLLLLLLLLLLLVGTLDKRSDMFATLFLRSGIHPGLFPHAIHMHVNAQASSDTINTTVTETDRVKVRDILNEVLFCETMLYHAAKLISSRDLQCFSSKSVSALRQHAALVVNTTVSTSGRLKQMDIYTENVFQKHQKFFCSFVKSSASRIGQYFCHSRPTNHR